MGTGHAEAPTSISYYRSAGAGSISAIGTASDGAPTDAGDYVAQITWGDKTASVSFGISKASIAKSTVVLNNASVTCTGKAVTPGVKSVVLNGTTLKPGVDYTVSYKNNTNPGTATATIAGKGNFEGSVTARFAIGLAKTQVPSVAYASKSSVNVSWKKVAGAKSCELQYR